MKISGLGSGPGLSVEDVQAFAADMIEITAFCYVIVNMEAPVLSGRQSDGYSGFITKDFPNLKGQAMDWCNNILPQLLKSVPHAITNYAALFKNSIGQIKQNIEILKSIPVPDPMTDDYKELKKSLTDSLKDLATDLQGKQTIIIETNKRFNSYMQEIKHTLLALNNLASIVNDAEENDRKDIGRLNAEIAALNKIIKKLNRDIIEMGLAEGAAAVSVAIGFLTMPMPPVGLLFIGAGAVGATLASLRLKADIEAVQITARVIKTDAAAIGKDQLDIVALSAFNQNIQTALSEDTKATNSLSDIIEKWSLLINEMDALVKDIQDVEDDEAKATPDFDKALRDLETSSKDWEALKNYGKQLVNIDIIYDPTSHNIDCEPGI